MYNFKNKTCSNHDTPKALKKYTSPMGVITFHCADCVNILELGFTVSPDNQNNS